MDIRSVRSLALLLLLATVALARSSRAEGIAISVDATKTSDKILHVTETMKVKPGPLTVFYPKWIPGQHGPDGPIANLTGLRFEALGKVLPWNRDTLDVFTFHTAIPPEATVLHITFDFLEGNGATDKLMSLDWNAVVLYPAGDATAEVVTPIIELPHGWSFATALSTKSRESNTISFEPVSLDRLVDSPLIAGEFFRAVDITPPGEAIHHELDIAADSQTALNMSAASRKAMTNLVAESLHLFGSPHYRQYRFLLTLTDQSSPSGLEHHESSINRLPERLFLSANPGKDLGGLLAHEFVHSWNGKYRRPADMMAVNFEQPIATDLLWVYEGMTDYLSLVLATRSGLWSEDDYRRYLAETAAALGPGRPGRSWRPLLDSAVSVPGHGNARGWEGWRRDGDFYGEGALIWLEVATLVHRGSLETKTFDDFCLSFFGGENHGPEVKTYTLLSLVAALNETAPYDWSTFLQVRLNSTTVNAPTGGITNAGWQVVYDNVSLGSTSSSEDMDDMYSIGLKLAPDGTVIDSNNDGPAFKGGITSGMKILAINGRLYTHLLLEDAIAEAHDSSTQPISVTFVNGTYLNTTNLDYHLGARSPRLEREPRTEDELSQILTARVIGKPAS